MIKFTDIQEATARTIERRKREAEERRIRDLQSLNNFIADIEAQVLPAFMDSTDESLVWAAQNGEYKTTVKSLRRFKYSEFERYIVDNNLILKDEILRLFEEKIEKLEEAFFQKYEEDGFTVEKISGPVPEDRRYKIGWEIQEEVNEQVYSTGEQGDCQGDPN